MLMLDAFSAFFVAPNWENLWKFQRLCYTLKVKITLVDNIFVCCVDERDEEKNMERLERSTFWELLAGFACSKWTIRFIIFFSIEILRIFTLLSRKPVCTRFMFHLHFRLYPTDFFLKYDHSCCYRFVPSSLALYGQY